jgi:hypothetical protein
MVLRQTEKSEFYFLIYAMYTRKWYDDKVKDIYVF